GPEGAEVGAQPRGVRGDVVLLQQTLSVGVRFRRVGGGGSGRQEQRQARRQQERSIRAAHENTSPGTRATSPTGPYALTFARNEASVLPSPSMPACCLASSSDPSGRNASWALATAIWSGRTMTPMLPRIDRTWTSPLSPPRTPGEALIRVAALPLKATRGGSPGAGRHTKSMTFFRTAVMELLYSGEAISRPSWSMKSCLSFFAFSGIPCSASRSWSNSGNGKSSRSISATSAPASRAPLTAMDTSFLLKEPLRVLPAKARMRGVIVLAPLGSVSGRVTSGYTWRSA